MKRIGTWLALLLFLHAVVHPLVHAAPLPATQSGSPTLVSPVAEKHTPIHDCELCRTANRVVRAVEFAVEKPCSSLPLRVSQLIFEDFGTAEPPFSPRAPPAS